MRIALIGMLATLSLALGGCAAMTSLSSEVSSFGEWPAARKPGSYAFERLPSQQASASESDALEAAARGALLKAGFAPALAAQEPDVLVQVGVRSARADIYPWADSRWWRGSYYRQGPWMGSRFGFGLHFEPARFEREIAVLIRDRASGKPLFEARASTEGNHTSADSTTLEAMFVAALMDFPRLGVNPRRVVVPLAK